MTRLLLSVIFSLTILSLNGQVEFGLKAGVSSLDLASGDILVDKPGINDLKISVAEANYGFHFGIYSRIKLLNIYLEPGLIFNSSRVNYNIKEGDFDSGAIETIKSEKYEKLDLPLMVGFKTGFFRVYGGPVARLHLNSISELTEVSGYGQKFKNATYAFQVGTGVDISKFRLEFSYEGSLSKVADHFVIDGASYAFGENPARFIASIGYKF